MKVNNWQRNTTNDGKYCRREKRPDFLPQLVVLSQCLSLTLCKGLSTLPLLLEVGGRPISLDQAAAWPLDALGQGELDLRVVGLDNQRATALAGSHGLATDDLDGVSTGPEQEFA